MDTLKRKLAKALREEFKGAKTDLGVPFEGAKLSGYLIWPGFAEQEQIDRQHHLWKIIRKNLTASELGRVSAIFTVTPDELAIMREEASRPA